jgi:hypothetical protein
LAGLFVAAEFGGRTFPVIVGFCHLFGGMIGDRSDRMVKTSKEFGGRTLAVRVFRAGILGGGIVRAG